MKKLATIALVLATLASSPVQAQQKPMRTTGGAAQAGTYSTYDNFAWGIGLGGLAVLAVVVGVTVAGATGSNSSFSH